MHSPRLDGAPSHPRIVLATFFSEFLTGLRSICADFERDTGIALEVQGIPYLSYEMWLHARFLGKNPPDVLLLESTNVAWKYGPPGLLRTFDDIIQLPNPLSENSIPWKEAFRKPHIQQSVDPNGHLYLVPYTQYAVGFFYNKDVYRELGLEVPDTWQKLMNNLETVKNKGYTAFITAIKPDDAQTVWIAALLLECMMRVHVPEVNIVASSPDWQFDYRDRQCTLSERIDIAERFIAFERGIIDPARAPEFAETARLVRDMSRTWRPDFLSLSGEDIYKLFCQAKMVHMMNGTWLIGEFRELQNIMRQVAPEAVFDCATFPFPELTTQTTPLVRAGGVNQNAGMRACLLVPQQTWEPWRHEAGLLLCYYLTLPKVARKVFANSDVYDIPALEAVTPEPEAEALLPKTHYAFLPVSSITGYDNQSLSEFWPLWQLYLGHSISLDAFLDRISKSQRASLIRQARIYQKEVDWEMVHRELDMSWEQITSEFDVSLETLEQLGCGVD